HGDDEDQRERARGSPIRERDGGDQSEVEYRPAEEEELAQAAAYDARARQPRYDDAAESRHAEQRCEQRPMWASPRQADVDATGRAQDIGEPDARRYRRLAQPQHRGVDDPAGLRAAHANVIDPLRSCLSET